MWRNCHTIPENIFPWAASCSWAWPLSWPQFCRSTGGVQNGCTSRCVAPRVQVPLQPGGWSWSERGGSRSPLPAAGKWCLCRRRAKSPPPSGSAGQRVTTHTVVRTHWQWLKVYCGVPWRNQSWPTGRKSLWEAHGLKSFFHSFALSLGKVMG